MHTTFRLSVFLLFMVQLFCSCTSDSLPEPDSTQPETPAGIPDAYQDKIRTQPYPKADNELYLNPAPLIVPQAMKTGERLQFSLSRTEDFSSSETLLSEPQEWCMYNLHRRLEVGTWYWRFRSTNLNGTAPGEWSSIYRFEVKNDTPEFVTPPFQTFLANAPRLHPRIYCFLDDRIGEARNRVTSHPEYAELQSRASQALKAEYTGMTDLYSRAEELRQHATYLYQAYHLIQKEIYAEKLRQLLEALIVAPPADGQLFASNFTASNIAWCLVAAYDLLYNNLSASDRTASEELMMRVARYYYKVNCGFQENHLFDNHFWQQNMRILFQVALSLYDKSAYSSEVLPMMEYYYELWTARAPASGFNRDGIWHNGTGYFSANILTLAYMPSLLSFISQYDYCIRGIRMSDARWFILVRRDRKAMALVTIVKRVVNPTVWLPPLLIIWRVKRVIPMPDGMPENVGSCCVGIMNCVFTGCVPSRITTQLFLPGLIKWCGIKMPVK